MDVTESDSLCENFVCNVASNKQLKQMNFIIKIVSLILRADITKMRSRYIVRNVNLALHAKMNKS